MGFTLSVLNDSQCMLEHCKILQGLCSAAWHSLCVCRSSFSCSCCRWTLQWQSVLGINSRYRVSWGEPEDTGTTTVFPQTLLLWLIQGKAGDLEWYITYGYNLTLSISAHFLGVLPAFTRDYRQLCFRLSIIIDRHWIKSILHFKTVCLIVFLPFGG